VDPVVLAASCAFTTLSRDTETTEEGTAHKLWRGELHKFVVEMTGTTKSLPKEERKRLQIETTRIGWSKEKPRLVNLADKNLQSAVTSRRTSNRVGALRGSK